MTLADVPVVDIAPFFGPDRARKAQVAQQIAEACRDIGFFVVTGHGVDIALSDRVAEMARQFFDQPFQSKMDVARPSMDVSRGYLPIDLDAGLSGNEDGAPFELNETFVIGPVDVDLDDPYYANPSARKYFYPNAWPTQPDGFAAAFEAYYRAMADLAAALMQIFAEALQLPEDFFEEKLDRHISRLRARNYAAGRAPPPEGQVLADAHRDTSCLTIYRPHAASGGLQVSNAAGEWIDVPMVENGLVINLGQLMARWTNDRWVAPLHRVVMRAPAARDVLLHRQSLIFFYLPNYDAVIECLPSCHSRTDLARYRPLKVADYLTEYVPQTPARSSA